MASWLQRMRASRGWGFCRFVARRLDEFSVPQVAASLTFTSLLALVPVLTVALAVVSVFPVFEEMSDSLMRFIQRAVVPQGADAVAGYLDEFKQQASNLTAIGLGFLALTSLLLIRTVDQTFNRIWRVRSPRPFWLQFLLYWALLTVGPLLLGGGLYIWGLLLRQSGLEDTGIGAGAVKTAASIGFNGLVLWLLYRLAPNCYVPGRHALVGAALTALLLEAARSGFAVYVGNFNSYQLIYGAFAAVPLFLVWLHLLWLLILGGAVLTASLSYWQDEAFRRSGQGGRFDDVLDILLLLYRAQQQGRAVRMREIRRAVPLGYDRLADVLDKLAQHGYVYPGQHAWVLKTDASRIRLQDLFRLFVYCPDEDGGTAAQHLPALLQPALDELDISLAEFSARCTAEKQQEAV